MRSTMIRNSSYDVDGNGEDRVVNFWFMNDPEWTDAVEEIERGN